MTKCRLFPALLLMTVLLLSALLPPAAFRASAAETDVVSAFEQQNVMDDLDGMTIDGKAFSVKDYAFDESKPTQVLMLAEFCYSFYSDRQDDFGLYLYVWNPQGLRFDTDDERNLVQLSFGSEADYKQFRLRFLSRSEESNYEGLFYKFKIQLSDEEKEQMLAVLNSSERTYHLSGIELVENGATSPHDYPLNDVFTYSGYAKGYGPNEAEDTLVYSRAQGDVFVIEDDDLHQTFYRPSGNVSGSYFKQDTLHTVYFSVPDSLIDKYGRLAVIRVKWLEALLSPYLVTGNREIYDALQYYLGEEMGEYDEGGFEYGIMGGYEYNSTSLGGLVTTHRTAKIAYNPWFKFLESAERQLERICMAFYSGSETDSADSYRIGGEAILDKMKEFSRTSTDKVLETYDRRLFSSVDGAFTVVDIPAEKEYSLTSEMISQTFWEKVFGTSHIEYSDTFNGIQAIHPVSEQDFGVSKEQTCQNLYIDLNDYEEFLDVYEEAKRNEETVYLFRFDQSDYTAWEVTQGKWTKGWQWVPNGITAGGSFQTVYKLSDSDTNGYFAEQTVYLGLDLIQMEWDDGGKKVVIPVVSSPIDAIADGTPPTHTSSDKNDWLKYVVAIVALILLAIILAPLLPYLLQFFVWLLMLPAKLVAWIIGLFKKKNE